jgi:hypothetical protein
MSTWHTGRGSGRRFDTGDPTARGPADGRLPRRPGPWGGDRGERARAACAPASVASAREHPVSANPLQVALFDRDLLAFLQLKCAK